MAAGGYHSLGLRPTAPSLLGENDSYGQCNVPAPNTDFVAVSAGEHYSLGLKVRRVYRRVGAEQLWPV